MPLHSVIIIGPTCTELDTLDMMVKFIRFTGLYNSTE